ncbi:tetratricopeptide repeat protein [uncultured Paludibaculum sp.]|uniref:tetratricopeptide repeat protein n=1 Tax=uncultured Paludibaculum sp. TaxID=1765020 RepID=UPI002AAC07CB|nr:tetratricopeptide repeat protein [uncultured Paludibaculum sp.]
MVVVPTETRDEVLRQMSVRRYTRLTTGSVMEIAVNCDAGVVVYGDLDLEPAPAGSTSKGTLKINAHIVDVRRVRRRGTFQVSGPLDNLSSLQTGLAWQVVKALSPALTISEEEFRRSRPRIRLDALESYVRGLLTPVLDQKHKLFTNAARLEPTYSQPCFQLGRLNFASKNYGAAAEWFQKVAAADLHYREALFFLGLSRYNTGDFKGAADVFRNLSGMVPLPEVWNNLGATLLRINDSTAEAAFQKAVEIDPADPDYHFNEGYALWKKNSFDAAANAFRASLERKPEDDTATLLLGRSLKQMGPRPGDLRTEAQERLKTEYNESAWLALKAMLAPKKNP